MTAPSDDSSDDSAASLFDMAADTADDPTDTDRVRKLKRILFDLAYLVMNADGTEHISEQMLVQKLERRMEKEGSVDVEARSDSLAPLIEDGPDAIRDRVFELADQVLEHAGDRSKAVGQRYLDFLRGLIIADASVAPEEHELFATLCEKWGVEKELPRS